MTAEYLLGERFTPNEKQGKPQENAEAAFEKSRRHFKCRRSAAIAAGAAVLLTLILATHMTMGSRDRHVMQALAFGILMALACVVWDVRAAQKSQPSAETLNLAMTWAGTRKVLQDLTVTQRIQEHMTRRERGTEDEQIRRGFSDAWEFFRERMGLSEQNLDTQAYQKASSDLLKVVGIARDHFNIELVVS